MNTEYMWIILGLFDLNFRSLKVNLKEIERWFRGLFLMLVDIVHSEQESFRLLDGGRFKSARFMTFAEIKQTFALAAHAALCCGGGCGISGC